MKTVSQRIVHICDGCYRDYPPHQLEQVQDDTSAPYSIVWDLCVRCEKSFDVAQYEQEGRADYVWVGTTRYKWQTPKEVRA